MKTKLNALVLAIFVVSLFSIPKILLADWPFNTNGPQSSSSGSLVIGDTDGDGVLDVLIVSSDRKLHCLTPNGIEKWSFNLFDPSDPNQPGAFALPTPVLVDLDGNPNTLEIVVVGGYYISNQSSIIRLYVITDAGTAGMEMARFNGSERPLSSSSPMVTDADRDGTKEIYFGSNSTLYALNVTNNSGAISLEQKWNFSVVNMTTPVAANVVGDENEEIIFGTVSSGKITCLDSQGQIVWVSPITALNNASDVVVADFLDGDGKKVIQRDKYGRVACLNASNGSIRWQYTQYIETAPTGIPPPNTPSVIDIDGDGKLDIIFGQYHEDEQFGTQLGYLQCLTFNGQRCSNWNRAAAPGFFAAGSAAVVRKSADNSIKIYIGNSLGLASYNSQGTKIWNTGITNAGFVSVAAADLDRNGDIELCYGASNGQFECRNDDGTLFHYTSPDAAPIDQKPWPALHQNNQNTGVYELRPIPLFTLTTNHVGNGSVTITPDQPTYPAANPPQVVTLTAVPYTPGRQVQAINRRSTVFDHWSGDLDSGTDPRTNPIHVGMDANKTITATFVPALQPVDATAVQ